MVRKIDKDKTRFDQIVRGKIKKNLQKYISGREMIGRKGRNIVSIPLPQIELPKFHYGSNEKSGVGLWWAYDKSVRPYAAVGMRQLPGSGRPGTVRR